MTRRPSDYQLHAGLLKGGVYTFLVVLAVLLLGVISLLGVFDRHPAWLYVSLALSLGILFQVMRLAQRLFALDCPACGAKTLEAELGNRYGTRHECRNCGFTLIAGEPEEPGDH